MTRVVIDANVYISALVFGGVPQKVIDLVQARAWQLCISDPIKDEVAEVLGAKFGWSGQELADFLPPLWERCVLVHPHESVNICDDPDDDRVLECAQEAQADFVVTGDDDLLRLKRFATAQIVTPRSFLSASTSSQ